MEALVLPPVVALALLPTVALLRSQVVHLSLRLVPTNRLAMAHPNAVPAAMPLVVPTNRLASREVLTLERLQ